MEKTAPETTYLQQLLSQSTNEEGKLKVIPTGVKVAFYYIYYMIFVPQIFLPSDCLEPLLFQKV